MRMSSNDSCKGENDMKKFTKRNIRGPANTNGVNYLSFVHHDHHLISKFASRI